MALLPLLATAISGLFSWTLLRRYRDSGRLQSLAWSVSLGMFAVASMTLFLADVYGWGSFLYRVFWLFGALLNVPWLAAGSVALAWPRVAKLAVGAMIAVSVYAAVATLLADLNLLVLAAEEGIPRGKDVWATGSNMLGMLRIASIGGWLVVVGVAVWTSRPRRGLKPPAARVRANVLISIGVTIVAVGGFALGRIGGTGVFSVTLAAGVLVMYAGFLFAGRAPRYTVHEPGEQAT